jgi:hypothetical protein
MDDVDPAVAASLDDLAACLKRVHILADSPALRALEQQTIHASDLLPGTRLKRARLTRSMLSDMLRGRKFPSKAFLLTFVDACGINLENDRRWEQAWDRLAVQGHQVSASPEEVEKLRYENEELRRQLTAVKGQAELVESRPGQEQADPQTANSQLDMAASHTEIAESPLEWERNKFPLIP